MQNYTHFFPKDFIHLKVDYCKRNKQSPEHKDGLPFTLQQRTVFLHEMDQEYQQLEAVRRQAGRELWGRHFENPLYLMLEDGTGLICHTWKLLSDKFVRQPITRSSNLLVHAEGTSQGHGPFQPDPFLHRRFIWHASLDVNIFSWTGSYKHSDYQNSYCVQSISTAVY